MPRKDVKFKNSSSLTLRGWLYTPTNTPSGPLPALVMSHGFTALKEWGLDRVAEAFVEKLDIAVLVYDQRNFGASEGSPRHEIVPWNQVSDISDAITYAQSLEEVDGEKVGIWGTSYSGGNVVAAAAIDKRVKAVISQAPFLDGPTTFSRLVRPDFVPTLEAGFAQERQARMTGHAAVTIPVVAENPLAQSALPTPDSYTWFADHMAKSEWKNETTLRSMELMRGYAPGHLIEQIGTTPMLMVVMTDDFLTAADICLKAYERALEPKKLVLMKGGHFDIYDGVNFEKSVEAEIAFLRETLCA